MFSASFKHSVLATLPLMAAMGSAPAAALVYILPTDTSMVERAANRLVHCAFPKSRTDNFCAVSGYGTTISLRDAWDSAGRIPSSHFD